MQKERFYYGWVNLSVLWICYFMLLGSITYAFGVIILDMAEGLKLTMTLAAGAYTCYTLTSALLAPTMGKFCSRYGTKPALLLGTLLTTIGCLLMWTWVDNVVAYYLVWIVFIGVGLRFGSLSPSQVNIARWFFHRRGLAMGILLTAGGAGGFVFSPLMNKINSSYGWRATWLVMALCSGLAFLLVLLVVREKPADVGQEIDGNIKPKHIQTVPITNRYNRVHKTLEPWTLAQTKRRVQFYHIVFLQICSSFLLVAIANQGINHMKTLGLTKTTAATVIAIFSLASIVGRLLIGIFSDKISVKYTLVFSLLGCLIGTAFLMMSSTPLLATLFAIFTGIGAGMFMVIPQNLVVNFFGTFDYSNINAFFSLVTGILSSFTALIVGLVFDLTSTYQVVWIISIVLLSISLASIFFLKEPQLSNSKSK